MRIIKGIYISNDQEENSYPGGTKYGQEEILNQFLSDYLTYRRLCANHFVYIGWDKDKGMDMRNS